MSRILFVTAPRRVEIQTMADEPLAAGQVRIESHFLGISPGTELNTWRGGVNWHTGRDPATGLFYTDPAKQKWSYPATLGYGNVGRVVETAPGVTKLKVGDMASCDRYHATPIVAAQERVWPVPPGLDPRAATFDALVRTALGIVHHAAPALGDTAAVFGCGVVGLLTIQCLRRAGATRILAFDPLANRREMAARFGADAAFDPRAADPGTTVRDHNDGRGADLAIESSANQVALQQATRAVGEQGRVVLASMPNAAAPFHFGQEVHFNAVRILGANQVRLPAALGPLWDLERRNAVARALLPRLELLPLITREFPFDQAPAAYEFLDQNPQAVIGAIFRCPAAGKP